MKNARVQSVFYRAASVSEAFATEILEHAHRYEKLLVQIETAADAGNRPRVRDLVRRLFHSHTAKLVSVVLSLDPQHGLSASQIEAIAASLDPSKDCGEPVDVWAEEKHSGLGFRPICSFGMKRTALQLLCLDVLRAICMPDNVGYLAKGRGAEVASDDMIAMMEEFSPFVVVLDVENFFGSVQQEAVRKMCGLPKAVFRNCLIISDVVSLHIAGNLPPGITKDVLDGAVRSGLPQGSRVSQFIAGLLLGNWLVPDVVPAERLIVYGDDLGVCARSYQEAVTLTKTLPGIFKSHPAGPFRLKRCELVNVYDGFNFLKYHFRRGWFGQIHRRPATNSYRRFEQRVGRIEAPNQAGKIDNYKHNWVRSFRRWYPNALSLQYLRFNIDIGKRLAQKKTQGKAKKPAKNLAARNVLKKSG